MAASGIDFSAHTVNHVNLSYEDEERAKWEIRMSKQEIERQLGRECIAFCYAFGRSGHNERAEQFVRRAGFKFSFQPGGGLNDRSANPLLLRRVPVVWESKKKDLLWRILRDR